MNEIEIKAHVENREALVQRLNQIATLQASVTRDDTYYSLPVHGAKRLRIRKEKSANSEKILVTYKRKELRNEGSGFETEVNEEMECLVTNALPLETFLLDSGFTVHLKKHKEVSDWNYTAKDSKGNDIPVTLELCNVPPLGDFLEIEILSSETEPQKIQKLQDLLLEVLVKLNHAIIQKCSGKQPLRQRAATDWRKNAIQQNSLQKSGKGPA